MFKICSAEIELILLLFFLGSASEVQAACPWQALPNAPLASRVDDLHFVNDQVGWCGTSSGQIYRTTDGGANWELQHQSTNYIRSIAFFDSQRGFAGTLSTQSVLFETVDGGTNWTVVTTLPTPQPRRICGFSIPDSTTIYGCGSYDGPATMIKSIDTGAHWTSWSMSAHAKTLVDVHFFDADRGFVVGGAIGDNFPTYQAVVLETVDGGQSWTQRYLGNDTGEWGWKIWFATDLVGYVTLQNQSTAKLLKTIDGGTTWQETIIPNNFNLQGVGFHDENIGWVGGWGNTSLTSDGGQTWINETWGASLNHFFDVGDGVMFASGETVYKRDCSPTAVILASAIDRSPLRLEPHPSPFNSTLTIRYHLPVDSYVLVRVYDNLGRTIRTLSSESLSRGPQTIRWDAKDDTGETMPSGVYQVRIDAAGTAESRAVVLVK